MAAFEHNGLGFDIVITPVGSRFAWNVHCENGASDSSVDTCRTDFEAQREAESAAMRIANKHQASG
ncbi:hypothetical protein [Methyloversatilis discipulorum]|uniref:hypothetical protein n=1 Tax=Methyloversatilis discipulorum TaxID=1119528 RepID=UPI003138327F